MWEDTDDQRPIRIEVHVLQGPEPLGGRPHQWGHGIALEQPMSLRARHPAAELSGSSGATHSIAVWHGDHGAASSETTEQSNSVTSRMNR
jgi:hypothetical protein